MRVLLFVLLFANLVFFAWSKWISVPPQPPVDVVRESLPKLMLADEGAPAAAATSAPEAAPPAIRCVSIGPFPAEDEATQAGSGFGGGGFKSRVRAATSPQPDGYWVYVGGIDSDATAQRVLRTLRRGGIDDARDVTEPGSERRISLGIFSERDRAERVMDGATRLKLQPQIVDRTRDVTVYWLDLDLPAAGDFLKPEDLQSLNAGGTQLSVEECPPTTAAAPSSVASDAGAAPDVGASEAATPVAPGVGAGAGAPQPGAAN